MTTIRSVLAGSPDRFRRTRAANELAPAPDSIAAAQLSEQSEFAKSPEGQPVQDCLSIADMRLIAAADHMGSAASLLGNPSHVYGFASCLRATLELSARAWWALDPEIDTRERVVRGIVDMVTSLVEVGRVPTPQVQAIATERRVRVVAEWEGIGHVFKWNRRGDLDNVDGVSFPGATAVIRDQHGRSGEISFKVFSAAAHGVPFGLMAWAEEVAEDETSLEGLPGTSFVKPSLKPESLVPYVGMPVLGFFGAVDRLVGLYGWDRTDWRAWTVEVGRAMKRLLPKG